MESAKKSTILMKGVFYTVSDKRENIYPISEHPQDGWPWAEMADVPDYNHSNEWPRLTVIMPSFNQGQFIEESIRSVLLQNYPNLEFMIMDGGSSDNTVEIIKKYEKWISYWVSEKDRGQSHAINKAYSRATGDYVAWLNSDDLYYPGALFAIAEAARVNPEAGMIYGRGAKIDLDSKVLLEIPFRPYNKKRLSTRFYILQQSSFLKRSVIGPKQMVEEDLHFTMDWELSIRVSRKADVVAIEAPIGMFRIYAETKTSAGKWIRRKEIARVAKDCNGFFDRNYLIFIAFYPVFKYELCVASITGLVQCTLCHWWRKGLALIVDPDSHMMH